MDRGSIVGHLAVGAVLAVALIASVETVRATRTTDFMCLRTAAAFLTDGRDPYAESAWRDAMSNTSPDRYGVLRPPPCPGRFGYPLWTALPFIPLAVLPEALAASIWQALLLAGAVAGAALAWAGVDGPRRSWPTFAAVVFASFPFWQLLIVAQFGGLMLLFVGTLAVALRGRRETLGGLALGALALKPHVAFLVPVVPVVNAWRERRGQTIVVAASLVGVLVVGAFAIRPEWLGEWVAEMVGRRVEMAGVSPTVWSFAARLLGDVRYAIVIVALCLGAVAILLRSIRVDLVAALAIATAGSLVLSPYIGLHDEVMLALPWAKSLAVALAIGRARGAALALGVLVCAGLLPWGLDVYEHLVLHDESASGVVPVASLLLLVVALRAEARHAPMS